MIKFFRKKRKELLKEGKTKSYLKYAIGEIVLVVIGILIAIALNDYNSQKNEKSIVAKKLKSLRQEVYRDSIEINNLINRYNQQKEIGFKLISQVNNPSLVVDCEKFISDVLEVEKLEITLNKKTTYNEMLNEGTFSKIEDSELKQRINLFYKYHDTFEKASWGYLEDLGVVRNYLVNNNIILLKYHQKALDTTLSFCEYKKHLALNLKNRQAFENYIYRLIEVREIIKEFYISLDKYFIPGIPIHPRK